MRVLLLSLVANVASADVAPSGLAANVSNHIISSKKRPSRPAAWHGPEIYLRDSSIYALNVSHCDVDNARAIERLLTFLRTNPRMEYPLVVVPGSSEGAGHHTAWPQRKPDDRHWVDPNFRSRLRHAFLLLLRGVAHTVLISGGSIDAAHNEYNEAIYGLRAMLSEYAGRFPASLGPLSERLIVDPWAIHSEVNVRNGDRLARLIGLDRNLIVTEAGLFHQTWWFVRSGDKTIPWSFDHAFANSMGYAPGELQDLNDAPIFQRFAPPYEKDRSGKLPGFWINSAGRTPEIEYVHSSSGAFATNTAVIAHWGFASLRTLGDERWDLGPRDKDFKRSPIPPPNFDRIGKACESLRTKLR